ncbi:hypothetical protein U0070_010565 [Myodes glareolus]|uniref:Uncharacterized protein n=1 Tax=Myodes glareolus TaxID=447135 RepID=A0AAW0HJR4_MYOGA
MTTGPWVAVSTSNTSHATFPLSPSGEELWEYEKTSSNCIWYALDRCEVKSSFLGLLLKPILAQNSLLSSSGSTSKALPVPFRALNFSLDTDISSFLLSLCLSVHLSTHPRAQPGLPPLLSLLLCVIPSKAIHLTYEPTWQLPSGEPPTAPNSASSLSFSRQVDTTLFSEFQAWRASPTLNKDCPFLERVYREDVGPCLDFTVQELSAMVRAAVEDNTLTIEPVASQTLPAAKVPTVEWNTTNTCALSGLARTCHHRIRLGDSESHYYISPSSRARITAVCNFFTYIRYIQQGLVRQDAEPMFWEIMRLRKGMSLAKLGFFPQEA